MAKTKVELQNYQGESLSPITIASNVLYEDGRNAQEVFEEYSNETFTPTIENSSSMFKVGQGDSVDYSDNIVNGAYESMVLKGKSMVNCIQEPSSQDVVLPYAFENGQHVTIKDTKESGALGVELKGQTLVNIHDSTTYILSRQNSGWYNNYVTNVNEVSFTITNSSETGWKYLKLGQLNLEMLKPNTKYLVVFSETKNLTTVQFMNGDGTRRISNTETITNNKAILTTNSTLDLDKQVLYVYFSMQLGEVVAKNAMIFEYQDGMENWDIPYFEGMASCKMPILSTVGKNLFDINKCKPSKTINDNGNEVTGSTPNHYAYGEFIPINNEFTISITSDNGSVPNNANGTRLRFYDKNKNLVDSQWFAQSFKESNGRKYRTISMNGAKYLKINFNATGGNADTTYEAMQTIQIEEGSTLTAYEPYKTSILSLPEEVVLRSLPNGVCDTFNTRTGEYVQRIGEYELIGDESENWLNFTDSDENTVRCQLVKLDSARCANTVTNMVCDKLKVVENIKWRNDEEQAERGHSDNYISIRILKSKLKSVTLGGFKEYLQANPIKIQYELAETVITKINLPSTLKSWNTTTHIYSEIPENTLYPILSHSNPSYPVILKPSTKYSIVANSYSNNHTNSAINFNLGGATASTTVGNRVTTITTPSTLSNELLTMSGRGNKLNNVMVIEGDVVGDEPYFEGICDCKSPILSNVGKNLFTTNNMRTGNIAGNGSSIEGNDISGNWQVTDYIPVKPLIKYYHSTSLYKFEKVSFYDINKKIIYGTGVNNFKTGVISTPHQCAYARYVVMKDSSTNNSLSLEELVSNNDIVVTQGGSNIAYEPYKSNTTTFDQKDGKTIVLRSLPNGVCDTLNVETGEYVQRIGKIVLDGGDVSYISLSEENNYRTSTSCSVLTAKNSAYKITNSFYCDSLPTYSHNLALWNVKNKEYGISRVSEEWGFCVRLPHTLTGVTMSDNGSTIKQKFKEYLHSNPVIVQCELATPIISTIDVQGFPYAYTNGHVQLLSGSIEQSLTPKVEYSVATNRNGQIRTNQKMVEKHQQHLDQLQAMIISNMVNTQYQQTLTTLNYDLLKKEVGE